MMKGQLHEVCHTGWYRDACKACTIFEGISLNASHAVWYREACQACAMSESSFFNSYHTILYCNT